MIHLQTSIRFTGPELRQLLDAIESGDGPTDVADNLDRVDAINKLRVALARINRLRHQNKLEPI